MFKEIGIFIVGLLMIMIIYCIKYFHIIRKYVIIIVNEISDKLFIITYVYLFIIIILVIINIFYKII